MAQNEALMVGDVVSLNEDIALGRHRTIAADVQGVVTKALNVDVATLYVVDFDEYGIRFVRRSALTFVERPGNLVEEWDNNAVMQRMLADPAGVFSPLFTVVIVNENGPNSAA